MGARSGRQLSGGAPEFFEGAADELIGYAAHVARKGRGELPLPAALEHVWNGFCALTAARGGNGFALNPISFSEIAAWADLTAARPTPWEVELIRRIDATVLPILSQKKDGPDLDIEVDAEDTVGVRTVMSVLRARSKAVFGKAANGPG